MAHSKVLLFLLHFATHFNVVDQQPGKVQMISDLEAGRSQGSSQAEVVKSTQTCQRSTPQSGRQLLRSLIATLVLLLFLELGQIPFRLFALILVSHRHTLPQITQTHFLPSSSVNLSANHPELQVPTYTQQNIQSPLLCSIILIFQFSLPLI